MAAYLIADVDVLDAEAFEENKRDVPAMETSAFRGRETGAEVVSWPAGYEAAAARQDDRTSSAGS